MAFSTEFQQPIGFGPSIHFGIDDDAYRNDPALNYSGIKLLNAEGGAEYWEHSVLNPERKELITDPLKEGRAFHTLLLEPEKFKARFTVSPIERGQKGKDAVNLGRYNAMKDQIAVLKRQDQYPLLFEGGYPEVAIFWRDPVTGLMMKSKHDYFTPFYSPDYKTSDTTSWDQLKWVIPKFGYHIQSVLYVEARVQIRAALQRDEALVYGDVDPGFLKAFINNENGDFLVLVFQKKKPPYGIAMGPVGEDFIADGWRDIRAATDIYSWHMRRYGPNTPWPVASVKMTEFSRYGRDNGY